MGRIYAGQDCFMILNPLAIYDQELTDNIIPSEAVYEEFNDGFYTETTEDYYRISVENFAYLSTIFIAHSSLSGDSGDDSQDFIGNSLLIGPTLRPLDEMLEDKFDFMHYYAGAIGDNSSEMVYGQADISNIPDEGWNAMIKDALFQPKLYSEWYANLASPIEPTTDEGPTVAVVNMHPAWSDKEANYNKMLEYIESAAEQNVDILVFPELSLADYVYSEDDTDYMSQSMIDNAETVDGDYPEKLLAKAIELDMYIIYGTSEVNPDDAAHPFNSAFIASPKDKKTYSYQKIHPVEGAWCAWGTTPLIIETPWGGMGMSVCMDSYCYPELGWYYAMSGCRIIVNPTATYIDVDNIFTYNTSLSTFASRDKMLVLSSNLVGLCAAPDGSDERTSFPGASVVIAPAGSSAVFYNNVSLVDEQMYISTPSTLGLGLDMSTVRPDALSAGYGAIDR